VLGVWGKDEPRVIASQRYLDQPFAWARKAVREKRRERVFLGSMMDFWEDNPQLVDIRGRVGTTVQQLPSLDWLILTKRPETIRVWQTMPRIYPPAFLHSCRHVWTGITVESQRRADERIPLLLEATKGHPRRWLSIEPLLEPIELGPFLPDIQWVIVGGESSQGGRQARHFDLEWCEEVVGQCKGAGVPVFVKQMGSRPLAGGLGLKLKCRHGGDMGEWPDWMRVREFPEAMLRYP
jgi:protein gp37